MKRTLLSLVMLIMTAVAVWADVIPATKADVGKVLCSDGSIYATVSAATAAGKTAQAMIAYVNDEQGVALGISLEDGPIADIDNGCKHDVAVSVAKAFNTSHPIEGGTWRLPTVQDWEHMFITCGSPTAYIASLPNSGLLTDDYPFESGLIRSMMISAGGAAFYDNAYGYGYWSDTELPTMKGTWWTYYFTFPPNGDDFKCGFTPSVQGHVRPCVEFKVPLAGDYYHLTFKEGTEDADLWTYSPVPAGKIGSIEYFGNKKVKGVRLVNAETQGQYMNMRQTRWVFTMPAFDDEVEVEYYPTLADSEDNSVAIDAMNGTTQETLCLNTVVPLGWYIFTAPFDISAETAQMRCAFSEMRAFVGSSFVNSEGGDDASMPPTINLYFDKVTEMKAGVPYLVKTAMERDFYIYTFSNVTVSNVSTTVESKYAYFVPTLSRTLVTDDPQDVLFAESPAIINKGVYPNTTTYFPPVPYHPEAPIQVKGFSGYFWLTPNVEKVFPDGGSRFEIVFGPYVPEKETTIGDANGDGVINMSDVDIIVNYMLGKTESSFNAEAADANKDGKIGMPDIMYIVHHILNGEFPNEE